VADTQVERLVSLKEATMCKFLISIALVSLTAISSAHAADNPLDARFGLDMGWFFLSTDTRVKVNGETTQLPGSDIDFDSTFGVDDTDRFRLDGMWRIATRHTIHALYFENNRSGTRDMTRDVNFGDHTYPIGASVTANTTFRVMELSYDYAFIKRDNYELAAGGGFHMLDMGLSLEGTLTGPGGTVTGTIGDSASTKAPLPVIGARGLWRISDKFYASAQAQFFYISFENYNGGLTDITGKIVWQVMPHLGLGLGYDSFQLRFKVEDQGNFDGRLKFGYGGAMVFATATF
jgi:hypothetical protein